MPHFAILLLLSACGGDPDDTGSLAASFQGGDFSFSTVQAQDACLGGALEAIFMPEGPTTPHAFTYPIYVPGSGEVPTSYDIDLRAPFLGMPVTVEAADGGFAVRGSALTGVVLDEVRYGDCTVDMGVDIDLWVAGADALTGEARLEIQNVQGERCPVFEASPCTVTLQLEAERI